MFQGKIPRLDSTLQPDRGNQERCPSSAKSKAALPHPRGRSARCLPTPTPREQPVRKLPAPALVAENWRAWIAVAPVQRRVHVFALLEGQRDCQSPQPERAPQGAVLETAPMPEAGGASRRSKQRLLEARRLGLKRRLELLDRPKARH